MLVFVSFPSAPEQIEIVADAQGIDDLILYLNSIKKNKDHMHLTIGTELDNYPLSNDVDHNISILKSVKLEYFEG